VKAALIAIAVLPTGTLAVGLAVLVRRAWKRQALGRALAAIERLPDKATPYGDADARAAPDRCPNCGAGLVAEALLAESPPLSALRVSAPTTLADTIYRCAGKAMPPLPIPVVSLAGDTVEAVQDAVRTVEPQMPSGSHVPSRYAGELAPDVAEWVLALPVGDRERALGLIIAHARETGAMNVQRAGWAWAGLLRGPCGFAGRRSEWRRSWR